jgi:hypothetical protein
MQLLNFLSEGLDVLLEYINLVKKLNAHKLEIEANYIFLV